MEWIFVPHEQLPSFVASFTINLYLPVGCDNGNGNDDDADDEDDDGNDDDDDGDGDDDKDDILTWAHFPEI